MSTQLYLFRSPSEAHSDYPHFLPPVRATVGDSGACPSGPVGDFPWCVSSSGSAGSHDMLEDFTAKAALQNGYTVCPLTSAG